MARFDLSCSWLDGGHRALGARGYCRDGKKGTAQIEYGPLTDPGGRPVAVRVFAGGHRRPDRVHRGRRSGPRRVRAGAG